MVKLSNEEVSRQMAQILQDQLERPGLRPVPKSGRETGLYRVDEPTAQRTRDRDRDADRSATAA